VLLPEVARDPERLARFEREAQLLASLSHPNIAAIHGIEQAGDSTALILEFIDGPTLADRVADGPIPLDSALPIAKQIAEALEDGGGLQPRCRSSCSSTGLRRGRVLRRPDGEATASSSSIWSARLLAHVRNQHARIHV
jgi:serine/threonine protein kinase